jgi:AcrR family transcriptional regulator
VSVPRRRDLDDEAMAELCDRVRTAFDGPSGWHDRIWAAGWAAMRYFREDPPRARLLLDVANGGDAASMQRRGGILAGLADLLDGGRGDGKRPGAMSRCTAEITAGAVYSTLLAKIGDGSIERGEEFLPELVYMAVMPYLGSGPAEDELAVQPLR